MSRAFDRDINYCPLWPESGDYPNHRGDLISSRDIHLKVNRGTLLALPGIQNIQQADFFCQTATTHKKTQAFSIVMIISRFVAT